MAKTQRHKAATDAPEAARRLAAWLVPHLLAGTDGPVAGYIARNDEIDPALVLGPLHDAGRALALPALVERDAPLEFRRYCPGDALEAGPAFGIPQPAPIAPAVRPAVLLVPLLAFDRAGHRLGYGGGYYDRTIAALSGQGAPVTIGLAYAGQEIASVPAEAHDRPLDMIATEAGLIDIHDNAGIPA